MPETVAQTGLMQRSASDTIQKGTVTLDTSEQGSFCRRTWMRLLSVAHCSGFGAYFKCSAAWTRSQLHYLYILGTI